MDQVKDLSIFPIATMPEIIDQIQKPSGLLSQDIPGLQKKYGKNIFIGERSRTFLTRAWEIVKEPMFIMLLIACSLYFILGKQSEAIMMLMAMLLVTAISVYQDWKSSVALEALREYTDPGVVVVRDGSEKEIPLEELVPGDIVILEEGSKIPADALILQENDLTVNESIHTGESIPVEKSVKEGSNSLFQGTILNTGKCYARITATGNNTSLGKLGKTVISLSTPPTQLQNQINSFVRKLALFGFSGFLIVCVINYIHNQDFIQSLLLGLTLAMSVIPEEIPVAFSSFMALGAYHLASHGIITRHPVTIENLGAVTVICLDKTGTITKNKMEVKTIYDYQKDLLMESETIIPEQNKNINVLTYALLASETKPFDAMERAIAEAYNKLMPGASMNIAGPIVSEYPLSGKPPMMTHVYEAATEKIIASKGAPERIMKVCKLSDDAVAKIGFHSKAMAEKGYRLLGVASARSPKASPLPVQQDDFDWTFVGILALYDPPKENAAMVIQELYTAGINVKLITGDFPETAISIARQIRFRSCKNFLTGEQVMAFTDQELRQKISVTDIFARMFPEAKLKVIEALKANGEITAMSGDGVNDGPALKSANIGIAMGKKGTEIARQAASLILTDDDLHKIIEAVQHGRKIYSNLKKATRYIVSIHIPILLTASVPLLLGWQFTNIFTPIHVIFLELIMGPTCSIFFEREPVEKNLMSQLPRKGTLNMLGKNEILISVTQGLVMAICMLGLHYIFMNRGYDLSYTRTMLFTAFIVGNIFLTLVDRSFTETILKTIHYKNDLKYFIIVISLGFLAAIHLVPFLQDLFGMVRVSSGHFLLSALIGFASVMWFELYKGTRRAPQAAV